MRHWGHGSNIIERGRKVSIWREMKKRDTGNQEEEGGP